MFIEGILINYWVLIGLLAFFLLLNIFNFIDRNLLIAFAPEIKSDFNLTNVQWGLLTGVYFLFFY